jgi:sodium transport system permease protein
MLTQALIVARKEITDHWRDRRSLLSSLLYALMGPAVVFMVSLTTRVGVVLIGMMSVFTLVSAFVGGMNVAMDTVAGERERRSLLPLLLNPIRRRDIVMGKWLAVSLFSAAGIIVNLLGFAIVLHTASPLLAAAAGVLPLALLAAALQLLISTECRTAKEAQNYLSMLVFLPMGAGMFQVFHSLAARTWLNFLPVLGQQLQLERWMNGTAVQFAQAAALGCFTAALAILIVEAAAGRLQRDEIVYGD